MKPEFDVPFYLGGRTPLLNAIRPEGDTQVYFQLFPMGHEHVGKEGILLTKQQALWYSKKFKDAASQLKTKIIYVTDKDGIVFNFPDYLSYRVEEN